MIGKPASRDELRKGKEENIMGEMYKQGFCDLERDDPRTLWDEDACNRYKEKNKQVIDSNSMLPYCLKVCGNCEYFTVGEIEKVAIE
ncbi:unnamed protein product [marine sediment metagenome]|uniref:Uncharacterized protein n=1 Tax=marine sediment metagenome TaxID=412755 RepID=X1ER75_9ZZZZ